MQTLTRIAVAAALVSLWAVPLLAAPGEAEPKLDPKGVAFFESKIRPVLIAQCYKCHAANSKEIKGGLVLDTREGTLHGGELGPSVVPGDLKSSLLIQAVRHTDDLKMPPSGKLPANVIADFEAWVRMGAPDPRRGGKPVAAASGIDLAKGRAHWAFQKPTRPAAPSLKNTAWPRSDLDKLVLARLEAERLSPVGDAEPLVLVRRLYFDLLGLPPSPAEIAKFEAECAAPQVGRARAVENLVERLLNSPHFGERWGRHWLDIARYAESNGNVDNNLFPYAWRYRDYVIAAFNADKPYDQFLREQIAGDLLPHATVAQRNEQLVATAFLALTSKPRPQNNPDFQMDLVADQIEVATTSLMGLTVACARCHDHKFDPIPQTDYYALAGIFTSSEMLYGVMTQNNKPEKKGNGPKVLALASEAPADPAAAQAQQELSQLEERRAALHAKFGAAQIQANRLGKNLKAAAEADKPDQADKAVKADREEREKLREARSQVTELQGQLAKLDEKIAALAKTAPGGALYAMGMREGRPADARLCIRGESQRLGETVPRGFVQVVAWEGAAPVNSQESGRRELAAWLASPENPLTARVMANRIWHHLFGAGIVTSPDNFGLTGDAPVNQPLLDYLAVRFVEQGWSVKKLIREIVLSRAYQLSGQHSAAAYAVDPENKLVWRHSPRRLDAEAIRDAMLAASGELRREPLAGTLLAKLGTQEVKNDMSREISAVDANYRSVYLPVVRNAAAESLEVFDVADSSLIVGARENTTVPSQALFLMNSPLVRKLAARMAQRAVGEAGSNSEAQVTQAFLLSFGRPPNASEQQRAAAYVAESAAGASEKQESPEQARAAAFETLCHALLIAAEFRYIE